MKIILALILSTSLSIKALAEEVDFEERNRHIFCSSHLGLMSRFLDEGSTEYQGLAFMARVHGDRARELGATRKHFEDVMMYLKDVFNNDKEGWETFSNQSERLCLPKP
jgi:hypothetical protein